MKSNLLFFLSIMLLPLSGITQAWMHAPYLNTERTTANFNDISAAFYTYWGEKPYEKGKGFKQFKRWEYRNLPRCYPDGALPAADKYYKVFRSLTSQHALNAERADMSQWTPLGLTSWENGPSGFNPGNGRINVVCVSPHNPQHIFAGSPTGGLWKSIDGGITWNTTYDEMPRLGVSAIAIHPDSSHIVFVGTGDRDVFDYSFKGIGIYKSTDGGNTFLPSGINTPDAWNSINKILFNPLNPSVMIAATNYGVFRSHNSGQSWQSVYQSRVSDLLYHPADTTILYGSGKRFIRSNDGGISFAADTALPSDTCRLEIAVTPADPDYVYVVSSNASYQFGALYRSTDGGQTFTIMSDTPNIFGYALDASDDAGQAWYDLAIAVSPFDAEAVYVGSINVWKSLNGGQNWQICSHWIYDMPGFYTHADIHYLSFVGNRLYCGSDGGVFYSDDAGLTWIDISDGLGITEFYHMSTSPLDPSFIVGGTQDNGTNRMQSSTWTHIFGGDGMQSLTDHSDINTFYFTYQFGGLLRTGNNGASVQYIQPNDSITGEWVTPIAMHPQYSSIIYAGYDEVYKSYNGGWTWEIISNNLTGGSNLTHLQIAPSNPDYIYAARHNKLYISKNDGFTWTQKTVPFLGVITGMTIDRYDPEKIWFTSSGSSGDRVYKSTDAGQNLQNITGNINGTGIRCIVSQSNSHDAVYVGTETAIFYTDTTLTQWIPFFNGLPNTLVSHLDIHESAGKIRAATYGRGLWESPLMPTTGVSEWNQKSPFEIFPNPANDIVNIQSIQSLTYRLMLFDVNGKNILIREVKNEPNLQLSLGHLVSGVYFLRIDYNNQSNIFRLLMFN